ncbi:MAG: hypothetical protein M4D80_24560 [Myxococcota bacterium]|nr:hypothetical protein [Deltaproteobacteria bacterium]MDQ3338351.1 hypothetical protein [Myxococcota bacterium]
MNIESQKAPARTKLVVRTLDAADRAHARAATRIHDVRNGIRSSSLRGLERVEQLVTSTIARARDAISRVDAVGADAVNRAQGVVGTVIERARGRAA